jgi:hypothetical protein
MSSVARKSIVDDEFRQHDPVDSDKAIPGRHIDLVHLARQSLGDRALETDLLGLFERQALHIITQITASRASDNPKFIGDLIHTLKGSARAVGAIGVAAAAPVRMNSAPKAFKPLWINSPKRLLKRARRSPTCWRIARAIKTARQIASLSI